MKYFYITVTTQYDGYEWTSKAVCEAWNSQDAYTKAKGIDWTHDNGIEVQYDPIVREITFTEYTILKEFLMNI